MSKKRYERYKLNGKIFVKDLKRGEEPKLTNWDYWDIWEAYNKPSQTKIDIWKDWEKWFIENNGKCWVDSRNSRIFTISGTIIDNQTGEMLGVHITPANNYCWSITE